jgi:hypothetical protein
VNSSTISMRSRALTIGLAVFRLAELAATR